MIDVSHPHAEDELAYLGPRLHALRNEHDWTLDDLAARTQVSTAYLSRIESGERHPSLAVLLTLARAYGVPLAQLFAEEPRADPCVVVRGGTAPLQHGNGLAYATLSRGTHLTALQPLRLVVPARRPGDERYAHEGEEWLYVLHGTLRLTVAEQTYVLAPGDAAHFDAHHPHRLAAIGADDVELILVASGSARPRQMSYL
jgi:transcriptional regulator with XRE-family HTH domain